MSDEHERADRDPVGQAGVDGDAAGGTGGADREPPSAESSSAAPGASDGGEPVSADPNPKVNACESTSTRAGDPLIAAYRHDFHKLRGCQHDAAAEECAGVPVNESVPLSADADAALLSRPRGEPEQTVANHVSPYRLSLVTGETVVATDLIKTAANGGREALVRPADPELLHATWLTSTVATAYSESMCYPYTSLKYHTLLVAALLDNYLAGYAFDELFLVATSPGDVAVGDAAAAVEADAVRPHRTVLVTPAVALHVTGAPRGRPAAALGTRPARSFADTWSRLSRHPFDVDGERRWRVLDAQLRRIRSWSVALQYIEDFVALCDAESLQTTPATSIEVGGVEDGR